MADSPLDLATLPGAWREDLGHRAADIVWRYEIPLDLSPADAWEVLVDTSQLNEALGLARFDLVERGGLAHAVQRHLGIVYDWDEPPWSWAEGHSVAALRRYRRGPAQAAVIRYTLDASPHRALIEIGFWVRSAVARWFLGLARHTFRLRYERGLSRMAALRRTRALPTGPRPSVRADELARTARAAVASGADARAIETLSSLVTQSDDASLVRMRPRSIARAHGLDEDATLLACLHGTRSGMLELVWDVVCPHCRGVRRSLRHLGDVPEKMRCEPCAIDVSTSAEHAIEVTFRPSPAIRDVRERWHCVAEAATRRHIRVQAPLADAETRRIEVRLPPSPHRLRLRGEARARDLAVSPDGPTEVTVRASESSALLAAPNATFVLEADRGREEVFVIEAPAWSDDVVSPRKLFNLQGFRDLFAAEYIAADVQLHVGTQTVLFTDLVGSTRMYRERGDARAFSDVKRHFALVFAAVAREHGAVVKTIGDAVMAAFLSRLDALASAEAMTRDLHADETLDLEMRISMATGSCIAVQLNSGIDYFGQTVNLAAKLQACAGARQIAFEATWLEDPIVARFLETRGAKLTHVQHRIEALERTLDVVVWTLD
jgi:class 3 adenylate cyclase